MLCVCEHCFKKKTSRLQKKKENTEFPPPLRRAAFRIGEFATNRLNKKHTPLLLRNNVPRFCEAWALTFTFSHPTKPRDVSVVACPIGGGNRRGVRILFPRKHVPRFCGAGLRSLSTPRTPHPTKPRDVLSLAQLSPSQGQKRDEVGCNPLPQKARPEVLWGVGQFFHRPTPHKSSGRA